MKEVIKVDVYGYCGTLKLNKGAELEAMSKYKFYLAFENSRCPSYATEKLYRVINQDLSQHPPVPVVLGPNKTWYKEHLPYKSFIHVDDFENAKELAHYLNFLDSNNEDYMEYLRWRRHYRKECDSSTVACQLCQKIITPKHNITKNQAIKDFESFWKKSECQKPVESSDTEQSIFLIFQRLYWSLGL